MNRNLKTVYNFASSEPFTEPQVRWWIFNAEQNGLAKTGAVLRIGRRVYIDSDAFERWISAQNPQSVAAYAVCEKRQDGRQRVLAEFRDPDVAKAYADTLRAVGDPAEILLLSDVEGD